MSSFFGLEEIIMCVIQATPDEHPDMSEEERFMKVMRLLKGDLYGSEKKEKPGRPEVVLKNDMHKSELYRLIAQEKIKAREAGRTITTEAAVRAHIDKIPHEHAVKDNVVKNWAAKYHKEGMIYEIGITPTNYDEKRKQADNTLLSMLEDNWTACEEKENEIKACLRKQGWPI